MQTEIQQHAGHDEVPYHGTIRGYVTGFVLALVLTAVPFALVMNGLLPQSGLLVGVTLAAIVQMVVHLHFFLHLDRSASERWNVMSLLFTVLIMAIFVAGSVWIMYSLHMRMTDHVPPHLHHAHMQMPEK
ncbi:cytochrome o ubiquinol oxidase subunit IV [Methylophilus sp. 3sh_L]|uniref:cytochrome o ubiquinol oxidase subunit IV n=1 Tax=Methylophilus sp. 3sh_L TaxID=3377114 RepID=UPI00398F7880